MGAAAPTGYQGVMNAIERWAQDSDRGRGWLDIDPDRGGRRGNDQGEGGGEGLSIVASAAPRVRIRLFGRMEIEVEGAALRFGRKRPIMLLDLLKVLVSLDEPIPFCRLSAALWPGYGNAPPRGTLDTALYRLRRLLGARSAIDSACGRVALAPEICWTDTRAFTACCDRIASLPRNVAPLRPELESCERQLLLLYRAPLGADDDPPLVARARQTFRRRFGRATSQLGRLWLALGDGDRRQRLMELTELRGVPGAEMAALL
jgi:hypothetical protein